VSKLGRDDLELNSLDWWVHARATIPESDEVVKAAFKLELLVSLIRDVLNIFLEVEERSLNKLLQVEGVTVVWDLMLAHLNDLDPVSVLDGLLGE